MLRAPRCAIAGLAVAAAALLLAGCGSRDQTVTAQEESASAASASHEASLSQASASESASKSESASASSEPAAPSGSQSGSGSGTASASATASAPIPTQPSTPTPAPSPQPSDGVLVTGEVTAPLRLTLDDLAQLPQQTIAVTYQGANGPANPNEAGPLLIDVLNRAGLRTDPAIPNDALNLAVVALGANGQQAVLSMGEISPDFGATPPILSLAEDGVAPQSGPLLVVPGDVHNGRYVPGVVELRVVRVS